MYDKKAFIKGLLSPPPKDVEIIQIDLDTANITICDIFRNFNTLLPANCRERYEIKNSYKVYAIICRSELLSPLSGLIFMIGNNLEVDASSRNYIIMAINESDIETEDKLNKVNDAITDFMAATIVDYIPDEQFKLFYCRYMYNAYEQSQDNELYD